MQGGVGTTRGDHAEAVRSDRVGLLVAANPLGVRNARAALSRSCSLGSTIFSALAAAAGHLAGFVGQRHAMEQFVEHVARDIADLGAEPLENRFLRRCP